MKIKNKFESSSKERKILENQNILNTTEKYQCLNQFLDNEEINNSAKKKYK